MPDTLGHSSGIHDLAVIDVRAYVLGRVIGWVGVWMDECLGACSHGWAVDRKRALELGCVRGWVCAGVLGWTVG